MTHQFTTPELDKEIGFSYYGARFYDPTIGRFLNPDTIIPEVYNPQVYNRYSYVYNNPLLYSDPTGHIPSYSELVNSHDDKNVLEDLYYNPSTGPGGGVQWRNYDASFDAYNSPSRIKNSQSTISGVADNIPILGGAKGLTELGTGIDPITGEEISTGDAALGVFLGALGLRWLDDVAEGAIKLGKYIDLRKQGAKDGHHIIQDAAVRELPGYSRKEAPAVELPGPSTKIDSPHYKATQVQRQSGGGTYAAERRIAYKALRQSGLSKAQARRAIREADKYFKSIGVGPNTSTRIPGNR